MPAIPSTNSASAAVASTVQGFPELAPQTTKPSPGVAARHSSTPADAPKQKVRFASNTDLASASAPRQLSISTSGLSTTQQPSSPRSGRHGTAHHASHAKAEPLRAAVQQTQLELAQAADSEKGPLQEAANAALVANLNHSSLLDKTIPMLHGAAHGAADGAMNAFGDKHKDGDKADAQAPAAPKHAKRWLAAADTTAVVPDERVALMNQLEAGAGDRLRETAAQQQQALAHGEKDQSRPLAAVENFVEGAGTKLAAAGAAGAAGAGVTMAMAGAATGGTAVAAAAATAVVGVGVDVAVNAGAGAIHGANKVRHEAKATFEVPKLEDLRAAVANGTPLAEVPTQTVPLFYVHHRD
jgi:hypothetical protein